MSSVDIEQMTKEQALEYMGLAPDANDFAIDEKFWKLSKKYRGKNDEESEEALSELSAVYNIACGRRDEALAKAKKREESTKVLGKTKDEWKNFFAYSWFKILVITVVVLCFAGIIYSMFANRYDCSVVAFGHFEVDSNIMEKSFKDSKMKNIYITSVDMVVPNEQEQKKNIYADQTLSSLINTYPNLLMTDGMTYEYYYGYFLDMNYIYENLKTNCADELARYTSPVYLSEYDAFIKTRDYYFAQGVISEEEYYAVESLNREQVLVGLRVTDRKLIDSLGIYDLWPDSDEDLILSVYQDTTDVKVTEQMLENLLKSFNGRS